MIVAFMGAGCHQMTRSNVAQPAPQPPHQPGYMAEQRYATTSIHETWTLGGEPIDVTLLRPSGDGRFPLVIYLPGLGESSTGGAAWRTAWAQAGYAVLSLQSVANGELLWSSAAARRADFPELAREQFSRAGLDKRLAVLQDLFEELNRLQTSGALGGVDLSLVALAGFDLGAQTAMAAAGETGYDIVPFALPAAVKCVIAFSPYADFSGAGFEPRFSTIHVPVLSVTSMADTDPYGLVTVPAIRRAPFDNMPPGQKYLLSLVNAPHALIAGKETPNAENNAPAQGDSPRTRSGDGSSQGGSTGRHRGGGSSQGNRRAASSDSSGTNPSSSRPVSSAAWAVALGQAQSVTTAYLDANLKNDGVATEWLTKDARRWLGSDADLIVK
jgi:dienelactone hydrolase